MIRKKRRRRAGLRGEAADTRRDDKGIAWRESEVATAAIGIVARLNGSSAAGITKSTQFGKNLGWDDWYKLSLIRPVKRQLHEQLAHPVVKNDVKTVGNLIDYIWSLMDRA